MFVSNSKPPTGNRVLSVSDTLSQAINSHPILSNPEEVGLDFSHPISYNAPFGSQLSDGAPAAVKGSQSDKLGKRSRVAVKDLLSSRPGLVPVSTLEAPNVHPNLFRVEAISNKLKIGRGPELDLLNTPPPEPTFNAEGKPINAREILFRKPLKGERPPSIEPAHSDDANFNPPLEHKKVPKLQEKYFIPAKEYPEINFIGLLIGPRGHTLKRMELESGTKISIRGKGSVKEGKRTETSTSPEEELHCLISGDSPQKIKKAKKLIERIIETSSSVPEGQNELKRQQLRELAALNGTLRDDENLPCTCCGLLGHRQLGGSDPKNNVKGRCATGSGLAFPSPLHPPTKRFSPLDPVIQLDHQLNQELLNLVGELDEANLATSGTPVSYQLSTPMVPSKISEASIPSWASSLTANPSNDWTVPTSHPTRFSSTSDLGFYDATSSIWMDTPTILHPGTSQSTVGVGSDSGLHPLGIAKFKVTPPSEPFVPPEPPSHPPPSPPPPPSTNEPVLPWVNLNSNASFEELPASYL